MALALRAPAKVNLGLRVLGRRRDGYHELDTVFHALELSDDVVAERTAQGIQLQVTGSGAADLDPGPDNLVHRAAAAFLDRAGGGARLHLRKRIPLGSGLGGGSSDAAATLRLLNRLCGSPLPAGELERLAADLGSDVPFFLAGGTQRGRGRGEILAAEPHPSLHFVLVLPPFGTATAAVYKNLPAQLISGAEKVSIPGDKAVSGKGLAVPERWRNDLEGAAMRLYPELARLRQRVVAAGFGGVRMSGSGSTLFLALPTEAAAETAERQMGFFRGLGARLLRTRSLERQPEPCEVPWPGRSRHGEQGGQS